MKPICVLAFGVLLVMLGVLIWASLQQALWSVPPDLIRNPWFLATLADAYCGFLIFYAWLFARESTWNARAGWLAALLLLGNVATAIYLIIAFAPRCRRRRSGNHSPSK